MPNPDDPIAKRIETLQALLKIERIQHMLLKATGKPASEELKTLMDELSAHTRTMLDRLGEDLDSK